MSPSSHTAYRRRGVAYATACALVVSVLAWALPVLALPVPLAAQNPSRAGQDISLIVAGRIVDDSGRAIPYAGVAVKGSPRSVRADADGRFRLAGLEAGTIAIVVSAQGYAAIETEVDVDAASTLAVITLVRDPVAMGAITVTATMKATSVAASPVKVNVVPRAVLQRSATNNLVEAISYVNGLRQQVDCGVCYTNSLRINGMEGPYTAVLIDGMPIMSSLASVYGLNGINPALVQQVEIMKGPSSTLYGSEAMAGVINVVTKDPRFSPRFALDASGTSDAEGNVDLALSTELGDVSGVLSGNAAYNSRFVDDNRDGFTDFPLNTRGVVFGKMDWSPGGQRRASLATRYVYEDRFGGVEAWSAADRGSSEVYGESIHTNRVEVLGTYLPSRFPDVRLEGSYAWHDQNSWYGDSNYDATQHIAFANALWGRMVGRHDLLVGATARYQTYDDNTPATATVDRRLIPGLLAQDEVRMARGALTVLAGFRVDRHDEHGLIPSPRLALKWDATEHTALRLNAGTGFRVVSLFAEDHAALSGARDVVIASELAPERSRSVTLNANRIIEFGPNPMMIDLDLFHTRFSNRIRPDYDVAPNLIVYDNLSGHAVSRGISLALNQNIDFDRFRYSAGVTVQDVHSVDAGGVREKDFFAADVRAVFGVTYNMRSLPLSLDYTGSVTGPMRLPSYDEPFARPERSPAYSVHNAQATMTLGAGAALYLSVKNVFDFTQPSPLVDPANPFGDAFDTAYVYGPVRGRHAMLGLRYGASR